MANYSVNQLKTGIKLLLDGAPHTIVDLDFVKPGKGQAFVRVKSRNLLDGSVHENTFKNVETLEGADVLETDMQYLYSDGDSWHFMDPETYEQHPVSEEAMGDAKNWLREQDTVCRDPVERPADLGHAAEPRGPQDHPLRARRPRRHLQRRHQAGDPGNRGGGQGAAVHRRGRDHPRGHPHR